MDWAHGKGFRATEAPTRSISKILPRQPKKDGHFPAMPYAEVPAFMTKLTSGVLIEFSTAVEPKGYGRPEHDGPASGCKTGTATVAAE